MKYTITLIFVLLQNLSIAQNPLTDSDYYFAYNEYEIMKYAKQAYDLDNKICNFLTSSESFDKKMAVVDAFNSSAEMDAGDLFFTYLKHKYNINEIQEINNIEDKLILSYLYFTSDIILSKKILKENEKLYSEKLSFGVLKFLINSQEYVGEDDCKVWKDFQTLDNANYKIKDIRASAITLIAKSVDKSKYKCSKELIVITNTKRHFESESKVNSFQLKNENEIYPNNKKNNFTFLGIDLTKSIDDFGLSRVNLDHAKPLLPTPFEKCKISKDHFLKEIDFDKQRVVFDKEGNIAMILLSKKLGEVIINEDKLMSKQLFEKVKLLISDLYGASDEEMVGFAKWTSDNYQIAINQNSNNSHIELAYLPKTSLDNKYVVESSIVEPVNNTKRTETALQNTRQKVIDAGGSDDELRKEFATVLTRNLNNSKYEIRCLTYEDLLVLNIKKRFYDDKPEDYVLSPFIQNLAYDLFYEASKHKGFTEKLEKLFKGIVFQNDFSFNYNISYAVNLGLNFSNMEGSLEFISKEDFKNLLFKFKI
jgi:hypothetical protein